MLIQSVVQKENYLEVFAGNACIMTRPSQYNGGILKIVEVTNGSGRARSLQGKVYAFHLFQERSKEEEHFHCFIINVNELWLASHRPPQKSTALKRFHPGSASLVTM